MLFACRLKLTDLNTRSLSVNVSTINPTPRGKEMNIIAAIVLSMVIAGIVCWLTPGAMRMNAVPPMPDIDPLPEVNSV